jgi:hypothetical protein
MAEINQDIFFDKIEAVRVLEILPPSPNSETSPWKRRLWVKSLPLGRNHLDWERRHNRLAIWRERRFLTVDRIYVQSTARRRVL